MRETRVFRRRVYHIGGFDQAPPEVVYGRFARELPRFQRAWSASAAISEPIVGSELAIWRVWANGPNWSTDCEIHLVRWDDVITAAHKRPTWYRLFYGLLAFFDFFWAGAFFAYLRASWRYALFFIYPFLLLAGIAIVSIVGGLIASQWSGEVLLSFLTGVFLAVGLFYLADRWVYLGLLLDDWIFSYQYIKQRDVAIASRLERIAAEIAETCRRDGVDEILVIGHSLGAVLAVDLLDRVVASECEPQGEKTRLAFFSVGASIAKIGLHRRAVRFRAAAGRVCASSGVTWADFRARSDVMNFYGSDLSAQMGLPATGSPIVRNVSIRQMIAPARYPRIRRNWYRMHCQFVRGNDRRAPYDYFMSVCGPVPAERLAESKLGAMDMFDDAGQLIDPARPVASSSNPNSAVTP